MTKISIMKTEYTEFVSKNNQHRFREKIHSKNKNVRVSANCGFSRCLVRILDYYQQKVPEDAKAFYLRPLEKVPDDSDNHGL